ncbi:hypothetical protein ACFWPK_22515 [Nocardia sp. NPDC058519]|uniref:hypothetical protein n=1 Tax=Nocardia sp. NPDC058519 TaxID=3346535 RepID=UPI00364CD7B6
MNSISNEVPASPRWPLAVLGAVVAIVLVVGGAIGGAWLYSQSREEPAMASTAYWETSAGQTEMATEAKAAIASHVVGSGYFIDAFGPPAFDGLLVKVWVDVVANENGQHGTEKSRMWFEQAFAAGDDDSLTAFGKPKVALSEGGL